MKKGKFGKRIRCVAYVPEAEKRARETDARKEKHKRRVVCEGKYAHIHQRRYRHRACERHSRKRISGAAGEYRSRNRLAWHIQRDFARCKRARRGSGECGRTHRHENELTRQFQTSLYVEPANKPIVI